KVLAARSRHGKAVSLWDPTTGKELRRLEMGDGEFSCIASSPDGRTLAAAECDGTVSLGDAVTGKLFRRLRQDEDQHFRVFAVTFSPDGKVLAVGMGTQKIVLWEVLTGKEIRQLKQSRENNHDTAFFIAYSPNGRLIASVGE